VDVFELVERSVAAHDGALIVLAGDNPAVRHLEVDNVARLSRIASGTTELIAVIQGHLDPDGRVVDHRQADPVGGSGPTPASR
jgi:hypothetical protein